MSQENVLYLYDRAIHLWLATFKQGGITPEVYRASPDRPWGHKKGEEGVRAVVVRSAVVTYQRLALPYNPDLRQTQIDVAVDRQDDGDFVTSKYPPAVLLQYQLDLRSRLRTLADRWQLFLEYTFNPDAMFTIDFHYPWGRKDITAVMQGPIIDNSDLELDENGQVRWIRLTATINLQAFLFPAVTDAQQDVPDTYGQLTTVPQVTDIITEVYASPSLRPNDPDNVLVSTGEVRGLKVATTFALPFEAQ